MGRSLFRVLWGMEKPDDAGTFNGTPRFTPDAPRDQGLRDIGRFPDRSSDLSTLAT
jgi:hypothetical protein